MAKEERGGYPGPGPGRDRESGQGTRPQVLQPQFAKAPRQPGISTGARGRPELCGRRGPGPAAPGSSCRLLPRDLRVPGDGG